MTHFVLSNMGILGAHFHKFGIQVQFKKKNKNKIGTLFKM